MIPRSITCSACGNALEISAASHESSLTCPRCLAVIKDVAPAAEPSTRSAPGAASTPIIEADLATAPRACWRCGESRAADWRACPFCKASFEGQGRSAKAKQTADGELRRTTSLVGVGVAAIGLLGALGLIGVVLAGAEGGDMTDPYIILNIAGGLILVAIAGMVLGLTGKNAAGGAAAGAISGVAIALIVAVLPFVLAYAMIANLFNTCCGPTPR